jgi:uridine kinase
MTVLEQIAQNIKDVKTTDGMPVKLVAIDGHGGAGKTQLSKYLADILSAGVLHTDDFGSYDNPMNWWPRFVDEALEPIKLGANSLSYKRGAWYKDHKPEPVTDQPVTKIMFIEGVGSSRSEFRPYLSYDIWVETPKEIALTRGIDRDLKNNEAGKTEQEIRSIWDRWHAYEDEYIKRDDPEKYANIVIDGTKDYLN